MPHLSPMSWLSILILLWLSLSAITASIYFLPSSKFLEPESKTMHISQSKWKWLQGGRA